MQKIILIFKEAGSGVLISFVVFIAVLVSVFSAASFNLIGANANRYINEKFAAAIPPNIIKVSPKPVPTLGLFKFALRKPAGTVLDVRTLDYIRSMKGIKAVYPLMASQIPMQATISIFGLNYRTDLVCIGATYDYISDNIKNRGGHQLWQNWKVGREMPILIPNILLDAYNSSMAEPNGLPRITEDIALGRKMQILFGQSSLKSINGFAVENATVVGFTPKVPTICLVIPLASMKYYNKKFKGKSWVEDYTTMYVHAADHASFMNALKKLKKTEFIVETESTISQEILNLKNNINLAVRAISTIIILLALIAIAAATVIAVLDRMEYYRILRILGASKWFLTVSILIKYAFIGLLGSAAGFALLDFIVKNMVPVIPIAGFKLKIAILPEFYRQVLIYGTLIPVLSCIPALVKLYTKEMSGD